MPLSEKAEQGLLDVGTSGARKFGIDPNLVVTGRTCVLGSSGSGKSYAMGVLCEELCRNNVPFAIVDTEGEHSGLKEKFEAIWVGEEPGCDLSWDRVDVADLANQAPDISPLILDVSDISDWKAKTASFLDFLYRTLTERRTPYLLILEESDKFIPQYGERVPIFDEVARRGRKRGLGLMICSQRPSLVDKNVLSQCANQLIGKLIIQNDLQSVAQFFPGRGLPKELTTLQAGEFYAMGGFSPTPTMVKFRKRTTKHGGITPALSKRVVKPFMGPLNQTGEVPEPSGHLVQGVPTGPMALGLAPSIKKDDVPVMVKRERRFGIFGTEETVTNVELQFRTLIQLGVRLRRGLLKRRFETVYVVLDGQSGKEVSVNKGLEVVRGFEKVLGLTTLQVEVLREVRPDSDISALDVASRLGESKGTVSRVLNLLNEKRLVRTIEVKRKRLFRRLIDLPDVPSEFQPLEISKVELEKGRVVQARLKEQDVREAVKGLWDGADIESFETFYYPVYKVELVLKRRHRQVLLDGRSGKELTL
jgi:DNA-binding transcriptional ArsR family regulator